MARGSWDGSVPPGWSGYVVGVMGELVARGAAPPGASLAVSSAVPMVRIVVIGGANRCRHRALSPMAGAMLSPATMVKVAHAAEYTHVGIRCGIMDQTIAVRARAGHALLLECGSGEFRHIPCGAGSCWFDTGARHEPDRGAHTTAVAPSVKRPWPCSRGRNPAVAPAGRLAVRPNPRPAPAAARAALARAMHW